FLLPTQRLSSREWFKRVIDMVTVMAAAGVGLWNFLIGPLAVEHVSDPLLTQVLSLAYPVGDLILLWGLLFLIYRRQQAQRSGPLMFLTLSVTAMILTDCVFGYQSLVGTYVSGGLVDLGWIAAYLFAGLAGVQQALRVQPAGETLPEPEPRSQGTLNNWGIYLPYAGLLGAYLLLLVSHSIPLPMHFTGLSLAVAGIILLVLVRQVISLKEIRSQADELEKTNLELAGEIQQRQRMEARLSHDALHDALTDLPNRALFTDRLGRAIEYSRRNYHSFSMLFLDLDHFKVVNDSLGHPVGDQLLISIGQRLKACLRSSDTIARFGGDEFVILIESTGDEAVTAVADRIQEELKLPFYLGDHKVYVSASIGIVRSVDEYERPEDILRDADIAMYQAKALGKSRSEVFDTHLRRKAVLRLQIENELRRALENNEFALYYQPIQALQSSRLVGFEALIRWNHPSRGLLLPAEFMQVAEESGIILPIGRWVLHEACAQTLAWQARYPAEPPITININISGRQFAQPNFVGQVEEVLQETGLNPASLKLEITEGVL
ncbi:MAG TPA: diguanylate cyclase, partial [Anaerolineaceae bacterium]